MKKISPYFGKMLRDTRNKKGANLLGAAAILQTSASYLSKIENGKMPPPREDTLRKWARLLGLRKGLRLAFVDLGLLCRGELPSDIQISEKNLEHFLSWIRRKRKGANE